jgi:hypothetical protein
MAAFFPLSSRPFPLAQMFTHLIFDLLIALSRLPTTETRCLQLRSTTSLFLKELFSIAPR